MAPLSTAADCYRSVSPGQSVITCGSIRAASMPREPHLGPSPAQPRSHHPLPRPHRAGDWRGKRLSLTAQFSRAIIAPDICGAPYRTYSSHPQPLSNCCVALANARTHDATHTRRLGSPLGSARLGSARHGSARLGSARLGMARLGSARLGMARLGSARLGSAWLGMARLGTARLGSAWLGSARFGSARRGAGLGVEMSLFQHSQSSP